MVKLLDAAELGDRLGRFERDLFRLETLPAYAVESDGDDYQRWLAGEPEPTWERLGRWLDVLRAEFAAGKISRRVRIFSEVLTDYERYACEFGYCHTGPAGEQIRVLHRGAHEIPNELVARDYWLVDDREVVAMHYDDSGGFLGAEVLDTGELPKHMQTRDLAWAAAEPFQDWWSRHPELHERP